MDDKILLYGKISTQNQLASTIRQTRKLANLTQAELAAVSFVGTRFISELENGKPTLEIGKVLQVMQTLGLEIHVQPVTKLALVAEPSTQKPGYKPLTPYHLEQFTQNQQIQVPVFKKDNALFLPLAGATSSHILKLAPLRFKSAIPNEIFCRLLAKSLNLPAPAISTLDTYQNTFLIERSDANTATFPAQTQKENLEWTIFHYLTGNTHSDPQKNLLCTAIYPDFSPTTTLNIDKVKDHWIAYAETMRVKPRFVFTTLQQMAEKILTHIETAYTAMENQFKTDVDVIHKICQIIENRVATIKDAL